MREREREREREKEREMNKSCRNDYHESLVRKKRKFAESGIEPVTKKYNKNNKHYNYITNFVYMESMQDLLKLSP